MSEKKSNAGRPKIEFNDSEWTMIENMCNIMCTAEEICHILGVSEDTLGRRMQEKFGLNFAEYYKKHSAFGKRSLRRLQYEQALKGNTTMLVWLGKQMLGQREKHDIDQHVDSVSQVNHTIKPDEVLDLVIAARKEKEKNNV